MWRCGSVLPSSSPSSSASSSSPPPSFCPSAESNRPLASRQRLQWLTAMAITPGRADNREGGEPEEGAGWEVGSRRVHRQTRKEGIPRTRACGPPTAAAAGLLLLPPPPLMLPPPLPPPLLQLLRLHPAAALLPPGVPSHCHCAALSAPAAADRQYATMPAGVGVSGETVRARVR